MYLDPALSFIRRNTNFIITAHETPDADAIGSECALYRALKQLGKNARIINADPTPRIFTFIDAGDDVETLSSDFSLDDPAAWCLIMVDANDINNIGAVREKILQQVSEYIIIDHHEEDGSLSEGNVIVGGASSTCEILYELLEALSTETSLPLATALYAGIVYDTGSFIYPKTSANTFRIARELVKAGVKPHYVHTKMYESNTISSLVLSSLVHSTLSLHFENHVAVQKMLSETLAKSGAPYEESQTLINVPLKSEQVKVSVFFKENERGVLRCSLRSKGDIDVAAIATSHGGGGHKNAAGFKSQFALDEIERKVLDQLAPYFS